MLPENYLPVLIFAVVGLIFPVLVFFLNRFFRTKEKRTKLKHTTYECGEIPQGDAQIQFSFQYYMFAIIFVVFDVVTVFLMIWALCFSELPWVASFYMMIFVGILLIGLTYALKMEAKTWI